MERLPLWSRILIVLGLALFTFFQLGSTGDFAVILFLFIPWLIINIVGFRPNDTALEICTALMILSTIAYQNEYLSDIGIGLIIATSCIAIITMIYNGFFGTLCNPYRGFLFWYDMLCIASIAICCIAAYIKGPFEVIIYVRWATIPCVVLYMLKTRVIDLWGSSGSSRSSLREDAEDSASGGYAPQHVVNDAIHDAEMNYRLVTLLSTNFHPTYVVISVSIPAGNYNLPSQFQRHVYDYISRRGYTFGVEMKYKID